MELTYDDPNDGLNIRDAKLNDVFKKQSDMVLESDGISNATNNAAMRHKLAEYVGNSTYIPDLPKPNPKLEEFHTVADKRSRETEVHTTVGKNTVKRYATSELEEQFPKVLTETLRGESVFNKTSKMTNSAVIDAMFKNVDSKNIYYKGKHDTNIESNYGKPYENLRENLTDFNINGRVDLTKTSSMVNMTPPNSTRNSTMVTTQGIYDNTIPFIMSKNAIRHTRY